MATDMAPRRRYPIQIPSWHEKRLIWWAHAKGTSKTQLSQNILQARIEANSADIDAMICEMARDAGMEVDEYKSRVLQDFGFTLDDALADE